MSVAPDSRAEALARFLRERSAAFSLSADVTGSPQTASAGMALLDAAEVAEQLQRDDPVLRAMSEAGLFESMPDGQARVVESPELHRAIQRPIAGPTQDADHILQALLRAASRI